MTYDKGNRHIHGWVLSEEQAMNQEGLDQSSWKQIWVEALFIGFEGWEVGLLIFDKPLFRSLLWLISSPNSLICWLPASSQNLPSSGCYYTQSYWVLRRRFKGMSLVLCETARSSLTFGSSIDVSLSDHILSQYKELMLGFLSTSWWTQDWWHVPDIDLCTEKTINKHLNWLIQSCPPCLHQAFWLACCEKLKLFFNLIIPYKINYTAFDGFSTLITGLVNTRIRVKVSDGSTFVT